MATADSAVFRRAAYQRRVVKRGEARRLTSPATESANRRPAV